MPLPHFEPGFTLFSDDLNQISQGLENVLSGRLANGQVSSFGMFTAPEYIPYFWAKVTGSPSGSPPAHPFSEVLETSPGVFSVKDDGISGTTTVMPLYEINGATIPTNTYVHCWKGAGDYYLTAYQTAATSSLTVVGNDPGSGDITFTVTPVTTLNFDETSGFSVSGSTPTANVTLTAATTAHTGTVTFSSQTFGGKKQFNNTTTFIADSGNSYIACVFSDSGVTTNANVSWASTPMGTANTIFRIGSDVVDSVYLWFDTYNGYLVFEAPNLAAYKGGTIYAGASGTDAVGNVFTNGLLTTIKSSFFVTTPTTSTSSGTKGQMATDGTYLYVCINTNTWARTALSTF